MVIEHRHWMGRWGIAENAETAGTATLTGLLNPVATGEIFRFASRRSVKVAVSFVIHGSPYIAYSICNLALALKCQPLIAQMIKVSFTLSSG